MKVFCGKILGLFIMAVLITALFGLRQEFQGTRTSAQLLQSIGLTNRIGLFDIVLINPCHCIGFVEQTTNNLYHVVFQDKNGKVLRGIYTKNQLHKVLVVPHTSTIFP
jgi:hypothetical protein